MKYNGKYLCSKKDTAEIVQCATDRFNLIQRNYEMQQIHIYKTLAESIIYSLRQQLLEDIIRMKLEDSLEDGDE